MTASSTLPSDLSQSVSQSSHAIINVNTIQIFTSSGAELDSKKGKRGMMDLIVSLTSLVVLLCYFQDLSFIKGDINHYHWLYGNY